MISRFLLASIFVFFVCEYALAIRCLDKPVCFCTTKSKKNIFCRDVQDVKDIHELLEQKPTVSRLRIIGNFTTVPSKAFQGFSIEELTLMAPLDVDIPEDFLRDVRKLLNLTLVGTRYRKIPKAFSNRDFEVLQSNNGLLAEIETEMQNMTVATEISLSNNAVSFLPLDAFLGTFLVQKLNLGNNELSFLDLATLAPLKALKVIILRHNHLHTIDGGFDIVYPSEMDLFCNNLTSVDQVFHGMWGLRHLDLGGNPNLQLTASTFNGSMKSLQRLYLSDNGIERLDRDLLRYFPVLLKLDLSRNSLYSVPDGFFEHNPSLGALDLSNNRLRTLFRSRFQRDNPTYQSLRLDGNQLESVSFGKDFEEVNSIDLSRNSIGTIKKEDVQHLKKLQSLNLAENSLLRVEDGAFSALRSLGSLILSENCLGNLNGSLRNITKLRFLNLRDFILRPIENSRWREILHAKLAKASLVWKFSPMKWPEKTDFF